MNSFIQSCQRAVGTFLRDEEGAQVVEYALIIAVVSIALTLALSNGGTGVGSSIGKLVSRLSDCFSAGKTCS
jgi:pilus assembly protein Flp/PilA